MAVGVTGKIRVSYEAVIAILVASVSVKKRVPIQTVGLPSKYLENISVGSGV